MDLNRMKAVNIATRVYFNSLKDISGLVPKLYRIDNDGTISDITDINITVVRDINTVYHIDITTPDIDSYMFISVGDVNDFLRIGNPDYRFLYYYDKPNLDIPYAQYNTNGDRLTDGTLDRYITNVYGFKLTSIDNGYICLNNDAISVNLPYITDVVHISGSILLNTVSGNDTWQQIAIPVRGKRVKEYLLDEIDRIIKTYDTTKSVTDVIERVSAYPGYINKFLSFVPGVTPIDSEGNFLLSVTDNNIDEVTGFWIKVRDYKAITNGDDIVFNWSNN